MAGLDIAMTRAAHGVLAAVIAERASTQYVTQGALGSAASAAGVSRGRLRPAAQA